MPRTKLPPKEFSWTPQLAYAVGLLATDGNLSPDGRHLNLRSSDLQLLETFKCCLELKNKVSRTVGDGWARRPCYRVQFGNVQLYRWFLTIGLFPNKTYTIGPIKIPDCHFRDFLRGHLDGDGCIYMYVDYYNTFKSPRYVYRRLFIRFISASKNHIEWLQNTAWRVLQIHGHTAERKPNKSFQSTSMWELKFAKRESLELIRELYYAPNVPCLQRKRKIADRALDAFRYGSRMTISLT